MALIRTKNNVPQPYVSESRDFQLLTRVLDFVQNSVKFDIDSITDIIDTDTIQSCYLDRLKSKLGFFTDNIYEDKILRIALAAFPHIVRYKGSEEGIRRCVHTFLNMAGIRGSCKIDIYNNHTMYPYTVRVGIEGEITNRTILKDMLSYVIPTGYYVDIYTYSGFNMNPLNVTFGYESYKLSPADAQEFSIIRSETIDGELENDTYNTVQFSTVYDISDENTESSSEEEKIVDE